MCFFCFFFSLLTSTIIVIVVISYLSTPMKTTKPDKSHNSSNKKCIFIFWSLDEGWRQKKLFPLLTVMHTIVNITHHSLLSCSLVQSSHEISDSGICYLLMVLLKMNHAKNWLFPHAVQSLQWELRVQLHPRPEQLVITLGLSLQLTTNHLQIPTNKMCTR